MYSISFTIASLVFNILLIIVYFSKKRVDIVENRLYIGLFFTSFLSSVLEVVNFIFVQMNKSANSP